MIYSGNFSENSSRHSTVNSSMYYLEDCSNNFSGNSGVFQAVAREISQEILQKISNAILQDIFQIFRHFSEFLLRQEILFNRKFINKLLKEMRMEFIRQFSREFLRDLLRKLSQISQIFLEDFSRNSSGSSSQNF